MKKVYQVEGFLKKYFLCVLAQAKGASQGLPKKSRPTTMLSKAGKLHSESFYQCAQSQFQSGARWNLE